MTTTDVLGSAILSDGTEIMLFGNGLTDGTEGHVYVRDISGNNTKDIGEFAQGKILRKVKLMASIGSLLNDVTIYGVDGGKVLNCAPAVELSGIFENYNVILDGLNIPLAKGVYLAVNTGD